MIAELQRPPVAVLQDGNWSRWAAWEQAVLSRVCDPASIAAPVASRRADLDDDDTTAAAVRDAVAKFINVEKIIDPETHRIRMPADAIAKAVEGISPHGKNAIATCRWLASINVPGVQRKRAKDGRYWVWVGTNTTDADAFEDWNLMPSLPA